MVRVSSRALRALTSASIALTVVASCKREEPQRSAPPPPPPPVASAGAPGACEQGGGELTDPVSATFFGRKVAAYCVDPHGEIKTYGDRGKHSMDEVCTMAFDGECEVYKRFGLRRVVALRYVDGAGGQGSVEIYLSEFKDAAGSFGMYTKRVVADADPAQEGAPRPLVAGGAGAMGTGRAYVWKGPYLVELQYVNENEAPDALARSSDAILAAVGKDVGARLPGPPDLPPAAKALPEASRIPSGVAFVPKEPLGVPGLGAGAVGYYKDGDKRWRVLALLPADEARAKDELKTLRRPGAQPVAGVGDEAAAFVFQERKDAPKLEVVAARKGALVAAVLDEEHGGTALGRDEKLAKLKAVLAATPAK